MTRERARSILLTALLLVSALSTAGVGTTANAASGQTTFRVIQGGECYTVTPISGNQTVEEFYDYRSVGQQYSSYGERSKSIQENQTSHLFLYNGTNGLSLVMLHDKLNRSPGGGAITFEISGLPEERRWVVEDDGYNNSDDQWQHNATSSKIDWMWAPDRTDGAAVRGLGYSFDEITIESAFGENSWAAQERNNTWPYASDDITDWQLRSGNGTEFSLTKGQTLTIEKGSCNAESPNADLSVTPEVAGNDDTVTFDASGSSDDDGIATYEWDFDGDGTVDRTTGNNAKVTLRAGDVFDKPGVYHPTVKITDETGNTATARATVRFETPKAALSVAGNDAPVTFGDSATVANDEAVLFNASESMDDEGIVKYKWDFDGDGEVDAKTKAPTTHHTYSDLGDYVPEVTVVDAAGNTATANASVFVTEDGGKVDEAPTAALTAPDTAVKGQMVAFDASGSSDDEGIAKYKWDFDGDGDPEKTTKKPKVAHAFHHVGPKKVTVTVVDTAGQTDAVTTTVKVKEDSKKKKPADTQPRASLVVPPTASLSDTITFDASGASDDKGIVKYKWDFDGDGKVDRTTTKSKIHHHVFAVYDEAGTYFPRVTVVDTAGHTTTAIAKMTVKKTDHEKPDATLHVPETVTVGEQFSVNATDFSESGLKHVCWVLDGHDAPDGANATHTFHETGDKTVTLHIVDEAGNSHMLKRTITVVADSGDGDHGSQDPPANQDPPEKGVGDDDDSDERDDGEAEIPTPTDPEVVENRSEDVPTPTDPEVVENRSEDVPTPTDPDVVENRSEDVTLPTETLGGENASLGEFVLDSVGANATADANATVPAGVRPPTAATDGFSALSYVEVTGVDAANATFTVSKARLNASGVTADAVTLFRFENGSWTAIETEQVGETNESVRFAANATNGTYAIGIDQPATQVADVTLDTRRLSPGDSATVAVTVENVGRANGTHEVELSVGGQVVATRNVSVPAGETRTVEFTRQFDEAGVYSISVGDERASVTVEGIDTTEVDTTTTTATTTADEPESDDSESTTTTATTTNEGTTPGMGVGVALVALAAAAFLAARRQ